MVCRTVLAAVTKDWTSEAAACPSGLTVTVTGVEEVPCRAMLTPGISPVTVFEAELTW